MFDIGWTEMLVIAVVMIVVVGPKDLPKMLRTFGRTTAKLRTMAGDFQKQFNEALKEAELDDVKKSVDSLRNLNPANEIKKQLNPFEKAAADVRAGIDGLKQQTKPAEPASPVAVAAEPLKNGATAMPVEGPTQMPEPPVIPAADAASLPIKAKADGKAAAAKTPKATAIKPKPAPATAAKPAEKSAPKASGNGAAKPPAAVAKAPSPAATKAAAAKPAAKPRKSAGTPT